MAAGGGKQTIRNLANRSQAQTLRSAGPLVLRCNDFGVVFACDPATRGVHSLWPWVTWVHASPNPKRVEWVLWVTAAKVRRPHIEDSGLAQTFRASSSKCFRPSSWRACRATARSGKQHQATNAHLVIEPSSTPRSQTTEGNLKHGGAC